MHPCPSCGSHVHRADPSCPHCGSRITTVSPMRTAAAALLGLTIACSGKDDGGSDSGTRTYPEPEYGVTITDTPTDTTTTTDTTDADTDIDADTDVDTDADTDSGTTGGVDYGVPTTYDSGTWGGSGGGGTVEPLYGVSTSGPK